MALLRGPEGHLLAFASMAPGYDGQKSVSVDLMRHHKDTPNGTMDYLFLCLLAWAKARGYKKLQSGVCPAV
ncbi:phosphatidylglycerol lysyltransferase domain-containing protein [Paenibacillus rhizoplanae]